MKVRVVTLEEIMRRIANGDSMDSYQAIHKMKMFEGEYVIQKVLKRLLYDGATEMSNWSSTLLFLASEKPRPPCAWSEANSASMYIPISSLLMVRCHPS